MQLLSLAIREYALAIIDEVSAQRAASLDRANSCRKHSRLHVKAAEALRRQQEEGLPWYEALGYSAYFSNDSDRVDAMP